MPPEPKAFDVTLVLPTNEVRTIQVKGDEHIWDAAQAAGLTLPAMCHQGYCLTCAARLEDGGEVDQSDSLVFFPQDREAGFLLPCTAKPRSALRIRTHQQKQMRQFRKERRVVSPYSWKEE